MRPTALVELIRGHGAHTDAIECFRGLTLELASRRPETFPYSVWQQLSHLNYWIEYEFERIAGRPVAYPEHASLSWPESPSPRDAQEWGAALLRFERNLAEMTRLAGSTDEALARSVGTPHESQLGKDSSLVGVLWQTLVHNSYHLGQVVLLRRALGAWPPPGGGDSW